jgi:hypothetical protein
MAAWRLGCPGPGQTGASRSATTVERATLPDGAGELALLDREPRSNDSVFRSGLSDVCNTPQQFFCVTIAPYENQNQNQKRNLFQFDANQGGN